MEGRHTVFFWHFLFFEQQPGVCWCVREYRTISCLKWRELITVIFDDVLFIYICGGIYKDYGLEQEML